MENTENQKQSWLEQFENDIIPWVNTLIEKETLHNEFLKDSKKKLEEKNGFWHLPWKAETEMNIREISEMIRYSDSMLVHFKARYEEYLEFAKQEKDKLPKQ